LNAPLIPPPPDNTEANVTVLDFDDPIAKSEFQSGRTNYVQHGVIVSTVTVGSF
jgi:hypothetical protein